MGIVSRVLAAAPIVTLDDYVTVGDGRGLDLARKLGPDDVEASGLRGRGGAGVPHWGQVAHRGQFRGRRNTKIRLLTRIAFGFKSPEALIALAMLSLGGHRPQLPGRAAHG